MIQAVIDGVIAALKAEFPGVKCYDEQVQQNLKTPCFVIRCINQSDEQVLGNRYYREHLVSVQYLPESARNANTASYKVQDALYQVLEYITVDGDLQRGTGKKGTVTDGVLTFLVNFNMFIRIEQNLEPMEVLEPINQKVGQGA